VGRGASIERALRDAVELRALARTAGDQDSTDRLTEIARRRADDIGPSVPKSRAAAILEISLTTLDKWIDRGEFAVVRRGASSREEVQTAHVLELADYVHDLRERGLGRAVLATAIRLRQAATDQAKPRMGSRKYFPARDLDRRRELELTPGERVHQAIKLTRMATRIGASAFASEKATVRRRQ
jgi:hypothetical protein